MHTKDIIIIIIIKIQFIFYEQFVVKAYYYYSINDILYTMIVFSNDDIHMRLIEP